MSDVSDHVAWGVFLRAMKRRGNDHEGFEAVREVFRRDLRDLVRLVGGHD